jgi:hypothetical protein
MGFHYDFVLKLLNSGKPMSSLIEGSYWWVLEKESLQALEKELESAQKKSDSLRQLVKEEEMEACEKRKDIDNRIVTNTNAKRKAAQKDLSRWQQDHPEGRWKQFLTDDGKGLRWDKVILSGISHGSTTAARMAKAVKVDRVVMFSGPRDQFEVWQKLPSVTPENRYFGFSHVLDDGWVADHYCRSWQLLGLAKFGPLVNVDAAKSPFGNTRRLISEADMNRDAKRAHSGVVPGKGSPKNPAGAYLYEDVWRYVFTHPVDQAGEEVAPEADCTIHQRSGSR